MFRGRASNLQFPVDPLDLILQPIELLLMFRALKFTAELFQLVAEAG